MTSMRQVHEQGVREPNLDADAIPRSIPSHANTAATDVWIPCGESCPRGPTRTSTAVVAHPFALFSALEWPNHIVKSCPHFSETAPSIHQSGSLQNHEVGRVLVMSIALPHATSRAGREWRVSQFAPRTRSVKHLVDADAKSKLPRPKCPNAQRQRESALRLLNPSING